MRLVLLVPSRLLRGRELSYVSILLFSFSPTCSLKDSMLFAVHHPSPAFRGPRLGRGGKHLPDDRDQAHQLTALQYTLSVFFLLVVFGFL
jgi:hypothetical protein